VPPAVLQRPARPPSDAAPGPAHLCLDVTALGVSLPDTLASLQHRSASRFGRPLRVVSPPHQQMMGDLVAEVAIVRAPDGFPLRLTRRACTLAQSLAPDWELEE